MEQRTLGRTGRDVSVIGLGTWQLGADWGEVIGGGRARPCSSAAVDAGVTFFDTADVYGDGRSEQLIGRFLRRAPRAGHGRHQDGPPRRRRSPRDYTLGELPRLDRPLARATSASTRSTWCSCTARRPRSIDDDAVVRRARHAGRRRARIAAYGVSVETCDEALTAIARPDVASVQIILNAFRLKPLDAGAAGRARRPGSGSSPGCRWPPACCRAGTTRSTTFARRRPPHLQPARRGVRRGGDVLRRGLRDRAARRRGVRRAGVASTARRHPRPGRARLDRPAARGEHGDPRSAERRAGPRERRGRLAPDLGDDLRHGVQRIYDEHLRSAIHPRW